MWFAGSEVLNDRVCTTKPHGTAEACEDHSRDGAAVRCSKHRTDAATDDRGAPTDASWCCSSCTPTS